MTARGPTSHIIQVDGSSKGNPGPAGVGVRVLNEEGVVVHELSRPIGIRTNNQAEYEAVVTALKLAAELPPGPVTIRTDSELVYFQMSGKYRVKDRQLRLLHAKAIELLLARPHVRLELIRRELNHETDRLAKTGADSTGSAVDAQ